MNKRAVTPPPLQFSYEKKKVYGKGQKKISPSAKQGGS